jgi:hypothetical protein
VLGLSAYRLKRFDEAQQAFATLSRDHAQNDSGTVGGRILGRARSDCRGTQKRHRLC